MTRRRTLLLGFAVAVLLVAGLLAVAGRYLTRDFRERKAVLRPLLATNAPLDVVVATAGHFTITRRGTPLWDKTLSRYSSGSKWDQHIAAKLEKASAYGHTSTMYMQTWIFLDENDQLVDFELGAQ
jgi:hypothetical protein